MKVLILDDEKAISAAIGEFLAELGLDVEIAERVDQALLLLEKTDIDLVFLDINLPDMDGISFLRKIRPVFPQMEVIMISGIKDHETILESIREGALDYIAKPFKLKDIHLALTRTEKFLSTQQALNQKTLQLKKLSGMVQATQDMMIAFESAAMKKVMDLADMVSKIDALPVLITGESGTGKELIAKYIHKHSHRKDKLFIATNCASIPNELFESEFFGHIKGSFTGAVEDQAGLFELANEGMLFLDEISEMDLRHQAKLLRVLESQEIKRIGARKIQKINTRVIAASNKDLKAMSKNNEFRVDLYHRLGVFEINIPPLRERKEDIKKILEYFIKTLAGKYDKVIEAYDYDVINRLEQYDFPGNIRELRNIIERSIIVCNNNHLSAEDLVINGEQVQADVSMNLTAFQKLKMVTDPETLNLEKNELQLIKTALKTVNYNKRQAAKVLGITPQALRRRMRKFGLL